MVQAVQMLTNTPDGLSSVLEPTEWKRRLPKVVL